MYGDKSIQARMDLLFIVLLFGMSTFLNRVHAIEYTVSQKQGDDTNPGTSQSPFASISRCAQAAEAGDTCWVKTGIYRETVIPAHSGTVNAPISFKVFPGEHVLISGADVIDGFSVLGNGRFRANIGWDLGLGNNQVFADGKMLWEARFPNANSDVMSALSGRVANPEGAAENWVIDTNGIPSGLDGAKITILPGPEWVAETGTVTDSGSGKLRFNVPYGQLKDPFYALRNGNPYAVWGHPALLDDAGEFYHNGNTLDVLLDPASHVIEAKHRDYAFILNHRSYINIEGFHVFAATLTTGEPYPGAQILSTYPNAATASNIHINDVHFRYVSHFSYISPGTAESGPGVFLAWNKGVTDSGVMLFGSNHSLSNSTIEYSAGNGITLAGSGHVVENTRVKNVDYSVTDGAALQAGFYDIDSSAHEIRHNSFSRSARSILTHRNAKNIRIIFNDLSDAGQVAADLGITYTYQTDGENTEIARNNIHGNNREGDFIGIYLDNGSSGYTIHHNTVWNVGKALQLNIPSTFNTIVNNTLVGSSKALGSWVPETLGDVNIEATSLSNNILVGGRSVYGKVDSLDFDEVINYDTLDVNELQFVDALNGDFRLLAESPAVDAGQIVEGISTQYDGAAPDLGAIEGISATPGATVASSCVYGDDCAPDYSGNDKPDADPVTLVGLLKNAGFESSFEQLDECGNIRGEVAQNWLDNTCWDSHAQISYAQDRVNPHTGNLSQRITNEGSRVQFVQALGLNADTPYSVAAWMRSDTPMNITLMLRDADSPYATFVEKTITLSSQWRKVSVSGTTPTANAFFMVLTEDRGTFWVDDAMVSVLGTIQVSSNPAQTPPREPGRNTSAAGSMPSITLWFLVLVLFWRSKISKYYSLVVAIFFGVFFHQAAFAETTYEDADDGSTQGWVVYDASPSGASIRNVYDAEMESPVIVLQGAGTANGYKLGNYAGNTNAWNNTSEKVIAWDMKFDQSFVVYVTVKTTQGQRYIYYTAESQNRGIQGTFNNYIHHGLGATSRNGEWKTITRDLQVDLQDFEPDNQIISVNGFLVRGSGRLDNIQLSTTTAPTEANWYQPKPFVSAHWQLQGIVNTNYDVELYDIDLFDTPKSTIRQLQADGKKVICYFSAGSYENWRNDKDRFNGNELGNSLDGWAGERWLDVRSANVRTIMKSRMDLAMQKACDGVEPDNVDGYTNNTGFSLTSADQLDYNRFLANQAHARGLAIGLKNDLGQVADLVGSFDFAVNEQCFEFEECDFLEPFISQDKAVLNIEYLQDYVDDANDRSLLCLDANDMGFTTLVLPLLLDDSFRFSCL
jgi:hypothetical protein